MKSELINTEKGMVEESYWWFVGRRTIRASACSGVLQNAVAWRLMSAAEVAGTSKCYRITLSG